MTIKVTRKMTFLDFKILIIKVLGAGKLKKSFVICHFCIFITFCPMKQGVHGAKKGCGNAVVVTSLGK